MKSVNQVKRQESLKKWLEIIKDQRASGLSALAYTEIKKSNSAATLKAQGGALGGVRELRRNRVIPTLCSVDYKGIGTLNQDLPLCEKLIIPEVDYEKDV